MSPSVIVSQTRRLASEVKFTLGEGQAERILQWARVRLSPDPYAGGAAGDEYQTTSLYFDTEALDVYYRRGSYRKSKYRVRQYGESGLVYLERKLKTRDLVSKRRSIVAVDELPRLCGGTAEKGWAGYWFHRRLIRRALQPACVVRYQRVARVAVIREGPVRLTLDRGITTWPAEGISVDVSGKGTPVAEGRSILELKYIAGLPALFKELIEEFRLRPVRFSKFRAAVAALGLAKAGEMDSCPQEEGAFAYV